MMLMLVLCGVYGLVAGSFAGALVWRTHRNRSMTTERSECEHCHHELAATDLVPVLSWLALGGRCRYCRARLPSELPLIELGCGGLFVWSGMALTSDAGLSAVSIYKLGIWLLLLTGLIALAIYDLKYMLLPNRLLYPLWGLVVGDVLLRLLHTNLGLPPLQLFWGVVLGALAGGGVFWLLYQFSEGRWIGGGDIRLGLLLGAWLGSPLKSLGMIFVASTVGLVVSFALIVRGGKKATLKLKIPFGPFLIFGAIVMTLHGQQVIDWYLHLAGV